MDGKFTLSNIISVNFENGGNFVTLENPAINGEFKVMTNLKNPRFTLLNSFGQSVEATIVETNTNNYSIRAKSVAGLYYLHIFSDGKVVTKKVLIP